MPAPKEVLRKINKDYPGALRLGSDEYFQITRIPTGIVAFDRLTGGGLAVGRFTEIYGDYSALKSTIAAVCAGKFQEEDSDSRVLWTDSEGSFDGEWMERFGVDLERLDVLPRPESGEAMTEIIEIAMSSGAYNLIVIDSIAALMPQRETEYDATDGNKAMGSAGKMNSAMMRRLTRLNENNIGIILINQMRESLGITFGNPAKPTGGRAIPYYAGQRIELRRGENLKKKIKRTGTGGKQQERTQMVARVINMSIIKDKTAPREGSTGLMLWVPELGIIDEEESLLIIGMEDGLVNRAASAITIFPNSKKRKVNLRGWDAAKKYLVDHPKVSGRLRRLIDKHSVELGSIGSD